MKQQLILIIFLTFAYCFTALSQNQIKLGIFPLNSDDLPQSQTRKITHHLVEELQKNQSFDVYSADRFLTQLKEKGMDPDRCVDLNCRLNAAKLLGWDAIAVGDLSKKGDSLALQVRLINVADGKIFNKVNLDFPERDKNDYYSFIQKIVKQLSGKPFFSLMLLGFGEFDPNDRYIKEKSELHFHKLGLSVRYENGNFLVTSVEKGSISEMEGIIPNDKIIEINGNRAYTMDIRKFYEVMYKACRDYELNMILERQGMRYLKFFPYKNWDLVIRENLHLKDKPEEKAKSTVNRFTTRQKTAIFGISTNILSVYMDTDNLNQKLSQHNLKTSGNDLEMDILLEFSTFFPLIKTAVYYGLLIHPPVSLSNDNQSSALNLRPEMIDNFDMNAQLLGLEFRPHRHFAIGTGYYWSSLEVDNNVFPEVEQIELNNNGWFYLMLRGYFKGVDFPLDAGMTYLYIPERNGYKVHSVGLFFKYTF